MKIATVFVAILYVAIQLPLAWNFDLNDGRRAILILAGCLALSVLAWKRKIGMVQWVILAPLLYVIAHSAFFWVGGYTIYHLFFLISIAGIVATVSIADPKWIYRSLLLAIPIQIFFSYLVKIPWFLELNNHLGGWGTVRHAIRCSTLMYAGVIAGLQIFKHDKNPLWRQFAVLNIMGGIFVIFHAYSNIIIAITVCSLILWMVHHEKYYYAVVLTLFAVTVYMYVKPEGFVIDQGRLLLWNNTLGHIRKDVADLALGKGIGSWGLWATAVHGDYVGHPHCEFLQILFEHGVAGIIVSHSIFLLLFLLCMGNGNLMIGYTGVSLSFFTNSGRYPDMALVWAIFAGLALNRVVRREDR